MNFILKECKKLRKNENNLVKIYKFVRNLSSPNIRYYVTCLINPLMKILRNEARNCNFCNQF